MFTVEGHAVEIEVWGPQVKKKCINVHKEANKDGKKTPKGVNVSF